MQKRTCAVVLSYKPEAVKQATHSHVSLSQVATDVPASSMDPMLALTVPAPAPAVAACMKSLVSLLDRLIMQQTQVPVKSTGLSTVPHSAVKKSCRVYSRQDHSMLSHCR